MSIQEGDLARALTEGTLLPSSGDNSARKMLLVFLPGLAVKPPRYKKLLMLLLGEEFSKHCDLLPFKFDNNLLSKERPADAAQRLADAIEANHRVRNYETVLIIGHSLGALIARQAVLDGHCARQSWVTCRVRLALLGDSNKGFVPKDAWQKMGVWSLNFRLTPMGDLFLNCLRGSPWVTGLRLAWIRFFAQEEAPTPPRTVQIRGMCDRVVAEGDCEDVNRIDGAELVMVPEVGHENILEVKGPDDPHYQLLREHITRIIPEEVLGKERRQASARGGFNTLIFLIHGIRDFAEWQEAVEFQIRRRSGNDTIHVVPVQYGFFTLLQFLLPSQRDRAVRIFIDRYVQEIVKSPRANVVVAAHSNGTYVFGEALQHCKFIEVERVYLAGSVLPRRFPWDELIGEGKQVGAVRNDCAKWDWPVGVLCAALQWLYLGKLGTSGYHGFQSKSSGLTNNR
jgi:hypothetical protein